MLVRQLRRIGIPEKKTVNRAGIVGHEAFEIEDSGIVLGRLDADLVQRSGPAEIVFRRIGIGMEQVRRPVDLARLLVEVLEQVVEVAVHAKNAVVAALADHAQQHFLALGQVLPRRNADLEFQPLGLVVVENAAPKRHVVVAFYEYLHEPVLSCRIPRGHRQGFRRRFRRLDRVPVFLALAHDFSVRSFLPGQVSGPGEGLLSPPRCRRGAAARCRRCCDSRRRTRRGGCRSE